MIFHRASKLPAGSLLYSSSRMHEEDRIHNIKRNASHRIPVRGQERYIRFLWIGFVADFSGTPVNDWDMNDGFIVYD